MCTEITKLIKGGATFKDAVAKLDLTPSAALKWMQIRRLPSGGGPGRTIRGTAAAPPPSRAPVSRPPSTARINGAAIVGNSIEQLSSELSAHLAAAKEIKARLRKLLDD